MAAVNPGDRPIRVVVVDDDPLVRFGVGMVLRGAGGFDVVGEAGDGAEAVEVARASSPDVVIVDVRMPGTDGIVATARLRDLPDPPQVLVLTTFDADDQVVRALRCGAVGYLLKDTPPEHLVAAVRDAATGRPALSPAVARRVIDRAVRGGDDRRDAARRRLAALSPRERAVAVEVGRGSSNADIGTRLQLSVPAVKSAVSAVLERLGLGNRVQIALLVHDAALDEEGG